MGPYKLSLHSGSDRFSSYGIAAEHTRGLVHLKMAGTSYLEALRTVASVAPDLCRRIYDVARQCCESDRASYHVSTDLRRVPPPSSLSDGGLPACLDDADGRQVLHAAYGSVPGQIGDSDSRRLTRFTAMSAPTPRAGAPSRPPPRAPGGRAIHPYL